MSALQAYQNISTYMSNSLDLKTLCYQCIEIAREAGEAILQIYHGQYSVERKNDNTPVTDADLAAHHIIINKLRLLTPEIPVLSEESEHISFEQRQQWQTYWLVDPLDGTREFIKRNGEFTVNIALIHKHRSIVGVIHVPVQQLDYYAWHEGGAYKMKTDNLAQKIHVRKLDDRRPVVTGSRSHNSQQMQTYMKNLGDYDLLCIGSSLKFCLIAEGLADLYPRLGPTSEWDSAAAHCIVEQAGGFIIQLDHTELFYNTKDSLLNPNFLVYADDRHDWLNYLNNPAND